MAIKPSSLNTFLLFKLPSAYLCGVRVKAITHDSCIVSVKHRWINQNPYRSMFWAVQGMAAELTTGALLTDKIKQKGANISMLVANNNARFSKKATGRITFVCNQGHLIDEVIDTAIATREGQTVWLNAVGTNEEGVEVSNFNFEWTIKVRN